VFVVPEVAFMSRADVAERWGTSVRTVDRLINAGELTAVRLSPRVVRVRPADLAEFERSRSGAAAPIEPVPAPVGRGGRRRRNVGTVDSSTVRAQLVAGPRRGAK